jgi:hypothetical protein
MILIYETEQGGHLSKVKHTWSEASSNGYFQDLASGKCPRLKLFKLYVLV